MISWNAATDAVTGGLRCAGLVLLWIGLATSVQTAVAQYSYEPPECGYYPYKPIIPAGQVTCKPAVTMVSITRASPHARTIPCVSWKWLREEWVRYAHSQALPAMMVTTHVSAR